MPHQVTCVRSADMRLVGQIHEINVPVPMDDLRSSQIVDIEDRFHATYQSRYARKNLNLPVEVQNWRLLVKGPRPPVQLRQVPITDDTDTQGALKGTRQAFFRAVGNFVDCPVYDRYRLPPGCNLPGPAIIEEQESTAVIGPQDQASIDRWLNLIIEVG